MALLELFDPSRQGECLPDLNNIEILIVVLLPLRLSAAADPDLVSRINEQLISLFSIIYK
ncbi:MAG TPA: hypothetical protein VL197_14055 [Nitrospirota bacterium]|nr:hypothetical protein [Nitrospirota bacterium]